MQSWSFRQFMYYFRDYLNVNPDGHLMDMIRKDNIFPFHADFWSNTECIIYFQRYIDNFIQIVEKEDNESLKEMFRILKYKLDLLPE